MTDITLPPMPQGVPYQESVLVAYARAAVTLSAPRWQPIETAPKDGRPVLGIHHGSSRAFEMYRGPHGWWLDTKDRRRDPSYWMPMPPPPDHFRDATKMVSAASAEPARVPSDVWTLIEKYSDAVAQYNEAVRIDVGIDKAGAYCLAVEQELRALLERYGRVAVSAEPETRTETPAEHIARDMREGRFPSRSEPKVVAASVQQPSGNSGGLPVVNQQSSTADERAAFEQWAMFSARLHRKGAKYSSSVTQFAWFAWQARAALAQKEADHG